ncbi:MAG: D-alanyl-D-alanine carboxypeptidase, partial [Candidatus Hydrogenedentes bacterium]|nr:D-alanyl-D-alanine carboxypeptidase [Candidatus Hydrogenedentota bacterium]
IDFEDTLEDWFPGRFEYGGTIKVKMLLNHTGGLHDHEELPELMDSIVSTPERVWTREEIMDMIADTPLDFIPGTSYRYSNAGYYVLGAIVENASGMTFQEALMDRIFKHTGIARTEVLDGKVDAPAADFYSLLDDHTELSNLTHWNYSWDWTAGAGVSTASDMIRFLNALFGPCLISKELREEMMTAQAPSGSYGYGMSVETYKGKVVVSHGGANFGNYGVWICIPEINAGFFVAFNRLDMTPDIANQMQSLIKQMKDMLLAQAGEL